MYEPIDDLLATDTWPTRQQDDVTRFYAALREMLRHPNFNADGMAAYMREKLEIGDEDGNPLNEAIDKYCNDAWAIWGYLSAL